MQDPACQDSSSLHIPVPLFALDAKDEHIPAYILKFTGAAVRLRTRSPLSFGRQLVMQYEGRRMELEVVSCRAEGNETYDIDCKTKSTNEGTVRDDWRMAVNWPAKVEVPHSKNVRKARVRDVSVFGLGIHLDFEPELNSLLLVHLKNGVGFGRVKHCRCIGQNSYFAGLYLEEFQAKPGKVLGSGYGMPNWQSLRSLLRQLLRPFSGTIPHPK